MKSKQIKRSIFAILMIAVLLLAVIPIGASAEENISQEYEYKLYSDNEIALSYYCSNESDIIIPNEYDGYPVIGVEHNCFNNFNDRRMIPKTIHISKNIEWLYTHSCEQYVFDGLQNLEYISVDEDNMNFFDIDGVLMDKITNRLIFIPYNINITNYTVPSLVKSLGYCSTSWLNNIKFIEFEGEDKIVIDEWNLSYLPNLVEAEYPNSDSAYPIFTDCPKLNRVIVPKYVDSKNDLDFSNSPNVTLYVHDNTYGLEWAKSHDFPYVIIDEPEPPVEKELVDSKTGVKVNGLMDSDAVLNVEVVEKTLEDAVSTFNITLEKDGNIIQPDGTITITIPSEYGDCKVLWIKDDGTKIDMNAKYTDGNYVFTTDHLSVYALVRDDKPTETVPTDSTEDVTTASTEGTTSKINPTASPNATSKVSTKDTATKDSANKGVASTRNGNSDNGTIQTGAVSIAVILFVLLASLATGGFVWYRRKIK